MNGSTLIQRSSVRMTHLPRASMNGRGPVHKIQSVGASKDVFLGTAILEEMESPGMYEIDSISPLGNYAVQINWRDQFNQVATFELLASLPRVDLQLSPASSVS